LRPLKNILFCPISASESDFNPQNTSCIPVVKIFIFLELEPNLTFFKGLTFGILIKPKNCMKIFEIADYR